MQRKDLQRRLRSMAGRTKGAVAARLAPAPMNYDRRLDAQKAFARVEENTMLPFSRAVLLYEMVAHCEKAGLHGDFVECGVWKGGSVGVMALANLENSTTRRPIHLFDVFDDICEPDPELDGNDILTEIAELAGRTDFSGKLESVHGLYDFVGGHGTESICRSLLVDKIGYPEASLVFHKGWFQDTVPVAANRIDPWNIAILRLDGDYYASTKVCLDHLYDRVIPGGFVVIDDYGAYEGCRKAVNDFFTERRIKPFLNYTDHVCRYWVKS